jgi:hypothetical protein
VQIDGALAAPSLDGVTQQLVGRPGSTVLLKLRRVTPHGEEFDLAHMTREILSDGMYMQFARQKHFAPVDKCSLESFVSNTNMLRT